MGRRYSFSGGRIYKDQGEVEVSLHRARDLAGPKNESQKPVEEQVPLDSALVPPDGQERDISRKPQEKGLYAITVSDGGAGTTVEWPDGVPMTVISSLEEPASFHGRWSLYLYVPKRTEIVVGFATEP